MLSPVHIPSSASKSVLSLSPAAGLCSGSSVYSGGEYSPLRNDHNKTNPMRTNYCDKGKCSHAAGLQLENLANQSDAITTVAKGSFDQLVRSHRSHYSILMPHDHPPFVAFYSRGAPFFRKLLSLDCYNEGTVWVVAQGQSTTQQSVENSSTVASQVEGTSALTVITSDS